MKMAPSVLNRLLLITVLMVMLMMIVAQDPDKEKKDKSWNDFKAKHGKKYKNNDVETKRRAAYEKNVAKVEKHNTDNKDFSLDVNEYADLTIDEFAAIMLSNLTGQDKKTHTNGPDSSLRKLTDRSKRTVPVQYDARTTGCFPPIKNQGQCGSCWAFSAATTLEFYKCYFNGPSPVTLSEQQLLDCTYPTRDGCSGGWMSDAYNNVMANGGLDFASTYPYTGKDGACLFSASNVGVHCTNYNVYNNYFTETAMRDFIGTYGPLAVYVDAGHSSFQLYSAGIYYDWACTTWTNHAVAVIGYGTDNGQDYWLIRNSWGTSWGENGYMRLARNANNHCGIVNQALYPYVN